MVSKYFEKRYIEPVIRLTAAQLINKKETLYSRQWTYTASVFLWGFYIFEKIESQNIFINHCLYMNLQEIMNHIDSNETSPFRLLYIK